MGNYKPQRIAQLAMEAGAKKADLKFTSMLILGFLAGAFISIGYLLDIRVTANLPENWGTFSAFLGAAVFPLGLILIILAGGELLTGNMMAVTIAYLSKKITIRRLLKNWFWIMISNFIGAIFVAYFFGHLAGLIDNGPFLAKTIAAAQGKLDEGFWESLCSAVGCNWLVGLAVWLSYGAEDVGGKILAIWFPIMGFVAIGFQHVVANMFLIPAAIFAGYFSWADYLANFVPVFIGNAIGGSVFVALAYWLAYMEESSQAPSEGNQLSEMRFGKIKGANK